MILIDMPIPENCSECRFETECGFCKAKPENFSGSTDDKKRPEWCPLKELKGNKWIDHLYRFNDTRFECKSCHRTAAKSYPFCPWCGLTMDGVEIEADFV